MQYYKDKNTNEVYAYDQADIDTVNSIASIEDALSKAQDALDALTEPPEFVPEYDEEGNQTSSDEYKAEREEYERAKQAVADAEESLAGIDEVFFNIRENLKHYTLMTDEEVEEHKNPPLTTEQIAEQVRAERDAKIEAVRWRIERAKDEDALGVPLTEPLEPLLQYVQALRDVPQQSGFPENVEWPDEPEQN